MHDLDSTSGASRAAASAAALLGLSALASAQGGALQTPGMPSYPAPPQAAPSQTAPSSGQADRFSSAFNPAFSFIVDAVGDYAQFTGSAQDDGFDLRLRTLEVSSQAWVDPNAWAYFVGATEGEELAIEEAAVHYKGFGGRSTLRAGRFFIDFGKQMQIHVHELRTVERPLALRAFLGDEVKGDGLQWDSWSPIGEETALRWSFGVFKSLLPEESAFPTLDAAGEPILYETAERQDVEDLSTTARVTGFTDVGEGGVLQLGASWRGLSRYEAVDSSGLARDDLSGHLFGADATFGLSDDTGQRKLTLGSELLLATGDLGAELRDPDGTPGSGDEFLGKVQGPNFGFVAFADYAWSARDSAGVQFSQAELPDGQDSRASEVEVYYTRMLSEFQRLRLAVSSFESENDPDSVRVALQYSAFVGAHGHGVNW